MPEVPTVATEIALLLHVPPEIASLNVAVFATQTEVEPSTEIDGWGVTLRMRKLLPSEIYIFPPASKTTKLGPFSFAAVAGPLSPANPAMLIPATVVIV